MIKNAFFIASITAVLSSCLNNNLEEQSPTDCSTSTLDFSSSAIDSDCGQSNGSIEIIAVKGKPPYTYSLDNGVSQTIGLFENLSPGNYTIKVSDSNTCFTEKEVSVANTEGFQANGSVTDSGCKSSNGTITAVATGGVEPYAYELDGGGAQAGGAFSNLTAGEYEILITDATGCDFSMLKTIITGTSYASTVQPIIANNCAISGCHDGSSSQTNFSIFTNVQNKAQSIKSRTQNGSMPKNGSLTQAEIDVIACWVDDGALGN